MTEHVVVEIGHPPSEQVVSLAEVVVNVQLAIEAEYDGDWELPVPGPVAAPAAVLIRPAGYVAWVGDGADTGVRDALTRWFGSR